MIFSAMDSGEDFWSLKVCTFIDAPRGLDGFLLTYLTWGHIACLAKMPELQGKSCEFSLNLAKATRSINPGNL